MTTERQAETDPRSGEAFDATLAAGGEAVAEPLPAVREGTGGYRRKLAELEQELAARLSFDLPVARLARFNREIERRIKPIEALHARRRRKLSRRLFWRLYGPFILGAFALLILAGLLALAYSHREAARAWLAELLQPSISSTPPAPQTTPSQAAPARGGSAGGS